MNSGYEPHREAPGAVVPGPRHWSDGAPVEPTRAPPAASLGGSLAASAAPYNPPGQPGPYPPAYQGSAVSHPSQAPPVSGPSYGQAPPVSGPSYGQAPPVSGPSYGQAPPVSGPSYGQGTSPSTVPSPKPPQYAPQYAPTGGPGAPIEPSAAPRRGRAWPGMAALLLVVALIVVASVQAYQINQLSTRLGAADRRLAEAQAGDGTRLGALEGRADELEKRAGAVFNPEAISSAVLPSVFRVQAGQFTGTAFAVGKPATGGGTNLFTNFHVIESVWNGGGREVFLERSDQRYPATIIKVDKANDVAQLKTTSKFTGLVTASAAVKSGQQIIVVGAPLGLEDSVTTGVVSAFRKAEGGNGERIQFDAPINPGNSGGPVINGSKQVVGIATAKARDAEGIGLAVPIKTACDGFKIC